METLDGCVLAIERADINLKNLLANMQRIQQKFTKPQASKLCTDLCLGMNYLHLCRFVHRDLNLGNFLLFPDWTLKISDFGTLAPNTGGHVSLGVGGTGRFSLLAHNSATAFHTMEGLGSN